MILWGVRVEGSFVVKCYDGPSAFREERARLERRDGTAQAVVSRDGGETWRLVPWGSSVRPDPRPPRRPTQRRLVGPGVGSARPGWVRGVYGWLRAASGRPVPVFRRNGGG
jgi:hypothetical protein